MVVYTSIHKGRTPCRYAWLIYSWLLPFSWLSAPCLQALSSYSRVSSVQVMILGACWDARMDKQLHGALAALTYLDPRFLSASCLSRGVVMIVCTSHGSVGSVLYNGAMMQWLVHCRDTSRLGLHC